MIQYRELRYIVLSPILQECDIVREIDIGKDFKYYATNRRDDNFQAQVLRRLRQNL